MPFAFLAEAGTRLPTPEGWKAELALGYLYIIILSRGPTVPRTLSWYVPAGQVNGKDWWLAHDDSKMIPPGGNDLISQNTAVYMLLKTVWSQSVADTLSEKMRMEEK